MTMKILNHARILAGFILAGLWLSSVAAERSQPTEFFRAGPEVSKYVVIITGPTVGQDNEAKFRRWSRSLYNILLQDYGYSDETVTLLYQHGLETHLAAMQDEDGEDSQSAPPLDGAATAADIRTAFAGLAETVTAGDQLTVFLIGHGSDPDGSRGTEGRPDAKFNIVGPDLTGPEFAALLQPFRQQDVVVVNTTSASYGFAAALSDEGRVVISATRSPRERYDPVFPRYFIEALAGHNGDRDKNQRVSMLEAFHYAKLSVTGWYEEQGRLAPEHAGLDDNGDGSFSLSPASGGDDGGLAEIAYLDNLRQDGRRLGREALALKARMQDLEREVFILRGRKAEFLADDYWGRMEALLVNLARTAERFDEVR